MERFHVFVRVCICTPFLCWYYYIVFKNRIIDTCHGITCASWYDTKNIWRENSSHLGQPRQRMQQKLWCVQYRLMFGVAMANRVRDRARLGSCLGAWARSRHLALLRNMTFSMPMPSVWSNESKMNSKAMEFKIWSWEQCACCASCTVWFSDSDSLKLCLLCIVLSRAKAKMEKRAKMAKAVIALGPVQAREIERLLLGNTNCLLLDRNWWVFKWIFTMLLNLLTSFVTLWRLILCFCEAFSIFLSFWMSYFSGMCSKNKGYMMVT